MHTEDMLKQDSSRHAVTIGQSGGEMGKPVRTLDCNRDRLGLLALEKLLNQTIKQGT